MLLTYTLTVRLLAQQRQNLGGSSSMKPTSSAWLGIAPPLGTYWTSILFFTLKNNTTEYICSVSQYHSFINLHSTSLNSFFIISCFQKQTTTTTSNDKRWQQNSYTQKEKILGNVLLKAVCHRHPIMLIPLPQQTQICQLWRSTLMSYGCPSRGNIPQHIKYSIILCAEHNTKLFLLFSLLHYFHYWLLFFYKLDIVAFIVGGCLIMIAFRNPHHQQWQLSINLVLRC